ncbi:FAD-binding oxidoreductase [uncultured Shimia sp.]|uniref:NAD(P)/FAD-dependent oxidoreductase n=1 Tax=uncultured Shimia sp. TaxID=573152 RepID=UPI002611703E|nr:FAD-binding oxidoreductase [uncultured Shimia sp.]
MNLLYSNDKQGQYPDSWYAATATQLEPFAALRGETKADVCVVGAGYTGLSTALHLAERGYDVALIEAHRVGFGASGRNGGQLGSGQRMEQDEIEHLLGIEDAHKLWLLAEESKQVTKGLIEKHDIECHLKPGIAHACFSDRDVRSEHRYVEHLQNEYGYDQIETLDRDQMQAICPSPKYVGGSLDMSAGHLHPLAYALGLARAAKAAGVRIYENTHVHGVQKGSPNVVKTDKGRVVAEHVVLACNGYLGNLERKVAARVMPINNYIAATRPLSDEELDGVLRRDLAIADSKFVINYFRLSHDKRLLFGGGETYGYRFPEDIAAVVRKPMTEIYPQLADIEIDYAWGGTLGITMKRMPFFARLGSSVITASGYSGHGVGTATHAGMLVAEAIAGQSEGFDTMARVPAPAFPGGAGLRTPLLVLAMTWFSLRDRLGF